MALLRKFHMFKFIGSALVSLCLTHIIQTPGSEAHDVIPQGREIQNPTTKAADLAQLQTFKSKPRVFVLSDILNEPDDFESLVRYLLYSTEFETCGIVACTSTWLRNSTHPEELERITNAYGNVVDNLNCHVNPRFQKP